MKKTIWGIILGCLMLSACSSGVEVEKTASSEFAQSTSNGAVEEVVLPENSEPSYADHSEIQSQTEIDSTTEIGGTYEYCSEHCSAYHSIPYTLIQWIGTDVFYEWEETLPYETDEFGRPDEDFTIVEVVEQFNISKEDFLEATRSWMTDEAMDNIGMTREEYLEKVGYTDAQVDAIYSGDQSQINEAFCGDLAYYNPSDGQLYSIYWLSDHTAADYQAAGVPVSEVERILDDASAMGGSYASLAEAAAPAAEAYALE